MAGDGDHDLLCGEHGGHDEIPRRGWIDNIDEDFPFKGLSDSSPIDLRHIGAGKDEDGLL